MLGGLGEWQPANTANEHITASLIPLRLAAATGGASRWRAT